MHPRRTAALTMLTALVLSIPLLLAPLAVASSPIFADITHEQAIKDSIENPYAFTILWFTAPWCGPCQALEEDSWSDKSVFNWTTKNNYTVLSINADDHPELVSKYKVTNIPMMIAIHKGSEIERTNKPTDSEHLIEWFKDLDTEPQQSQRPTSKSNTDFLHRLEAAKALTAQSKFPQAIDEYLWLWENAPNRTPGVQASRLVYVASGMKDLAKKSLDAQRVFTKLRDDLTPKINENPHSKEILSDWVVLNLRVLNDKDTLNSWIENLKRNDPRPEVTIKKIHHIIKDFLVETNNWELFGKGLRSPDMTISMYANMFETEYPKHFTPESIEMIESTTRAMVIEELSNAHAGYLAIDREEDAWKITQAMFKYIDTKESHTAILTKALAADQVKPKHLELTSKADPVLKGKCKVALARKKLADD
ncbi:MAG: thioredoxin family protein [Phycisphaerales bacterium]